MQTTTQIWETVKILYSGKSYPRGNSWHKIRADKEQLAKNAKKEHKHNKNIKPEEREAQHNNNHNYNKKIVQDTTSQVHSHCHRTASQHWAGVDASIISWWR
jgi:hypothetical protein